MGIRSSLTTIIMAVAIGVTFVPLTAQTIRGRLLDNETNRPVDLGLVMMFTESGDSVTETITNQDGYFSLTSPDPGSFLLVASAYGYRETSAGVFELGEDGEMTVEFNVRPEPLALDGVLVALDRPVFDHKLIRQGFVRRLQRGLGHFLTPYEIERSPTLETEALFDRIPGVVVGRGNLLAHLGDRIQMRSSTGGLCTPAVFVDGVSAPYDQDSGVSLSMLVPRDAVQAVEVYRRAAEVPVEYGVTHNRSSSAAAGTCGVIVFWTKSGLAPGQQFAGGGARSAASAAGSEVNRSLPSVKEEGTPPTPGERIRMELSAAVAEQLGLPSPWEGTYVTLRDRELVANDASQGRPVAVPLDAVILLQVQRKRSWGHAAVRGTLAGAALSVGAWLTLNFLCRAACEGNDVMLPALATGTVLGLLVFAQGPRDHWVRAPVPGRDPR